MRPGNGGEQGRVRRSPPSADLPGSSANCLRGPVLWSEGRTGAHRQERGRRDLAHPGQRLEHLDGSCLSKWLLEHDPEARVLVITDRDELDKQISGVMKNAGVIGAESPSPRISSRAEFVEKLGAATPRVLCALFHKFDTSDLEGDPPPANGHPVASQSHAAAPRAFPATTPAAMSRPKPWRKPQRHSRASARSGCRPPALTCSRDVAADGQPAGLQRRPLHRLPLLSK